MTREYKEAATEVLDILAHTSREKVNIIPQSFINYLKQNQLNDYWFRLDYTKPINEMNIKVETKGILATICRNWWWNIEEKEEYEKIRTERKRIIQEEARKKYNPDDLFKRRKI